MSSQQGTTQPRADSALAFIALGANLESLAGPPTITLTRVIDQLRSWSVGQFAASSLYVSSPVDCAAGTPDFINGAVCLELPGNTAADQLLSRLQKLEQAFGRRRNGPGNQSRPLDLDLIAFADLQLSSDRLTLPHPRFHQRRFVLAPLAELNPGLVLAPHRQSVSEMLHSLSDEQLCQRLDIS